MFYSQLSPKNKLTPNWLRKYALGLFDLLFVKPKERKAYTFKRLFIKSCSCSFPAWCDLLLWCVGTDLWFVSFDAACSWAFSAVVAEQITLHVKNLCLRSERPSSWEREQRECKEVDGPLPAEAPVLSERPLCRAEQVSNPSLEHTLNYRHLSTRGPVDAKVIAQLPLSVSAFHFSSQAMKASFLPSLLISLSPPQLLCLLWRSFNQTAHWLSWGHWLPCVACVCGSCLQLIFGCVNTALMLWTSSSSLCTRQLLIQSKSGAGSRSVRCSSRWIRQLCRMKGRLFYRLSQLTNKGSGMGLLDKEKGQWELKFSITLQFNERKEQKAQSLVFPKAEMIIFELSFCSAVLKSKKS